MKAFGTRPTYQIFSVITLVTGIIYLLFNIFYLSKRPQVEGNDIVKKKPKTPKIEAGKENGIIPDLDDSKAKKEKMSHELEKIAHELENNSVPYIVDDIEAINNAKNLDIIESVNTEDVPEDNQNDVEKSNQENQTRQRHAQQNGSVNPAFEGDEDDKCKVTVEKEPKSK